MKNNFLLLLAITISLIACQPENRVFIEHQELSPDFEWLKKDKRSFTVPVKSGVDYNLSLSFRYTTGYQYKVGRVKVTETSPSGAIQVYEYDLKVREANGDYIGDPGLDIWDSEHVVATNKQYKETGNYTYILEHNMPQDPMNFVMEIGVILDVVKQI
jgi:gliding motility-associated lipoprotein GldH